MLERRGLKDREWAVEWEASAQEFLLEKGFSPEMGARPLKRAIDQYVIAPLAATIVERRFPEGDQFVFVRSDGRAIQAEFVDPDGDAPASRAGSAAHGCRGPAGHDPGAGGHGRRGRRRSRASTPASPQALASAEWEDLKMRLSQEMSAAGFLVAARPPRDAGAAGADGSREGGDEHGRGLARAPRQGHGARRQVLARAGGAAGAAAAPDQGGHPRRARGSADRGRAAGRAGAASAGRPRGDARMVRAACWSMYRALGQQPAHATRRDRRRRRRGLPLLRDQRLRRPSPAGAARPACMCWRRDDDKGRGRATARVRLAVAPLGDLPADKLRARACSRRWSAARRRMPSCAATAASPRRWCAT